MTNNYPIFQHSLERFPLMLEIPPDGPQDSFKCEVANRYCSEKNHILERLNLTDHKYPIDRTG